MATPVYYFEPAARAAVLQNEQGGLSAGTTNGGRLEDKITSPNLESEHEQPATFGVEIGGHFPHFNFEINLALARRRLENEDRMNSKGDGGDINHLGSGPGQQVSTREVRTYIL